MSPSAKEKEMQFGEAIILRACPRADGTQELELNAVCPAANYERLNDSEVLSAKLQDYIEMRDYLSDPDEYRYFQRRMARRADTHQTRGACPAFRDAPPAQ